MKYENIAVGSFLERPNRFIALVEIDGRIEKCHVKNTGRCRELLTPGVRLYLQDFYEEGNPENTDTKESAIKQKTKFPRKTRYDVIAVEKGDQIVNMDSQVPNKAVAQWLCQSGLFSEDAVILSEQKYGNSRFDFYIEDGERKAFMEVKGVTLEENGIARFPDAPTERGVKHIRELCQCLQDGYEAYVFFLIQMKGVDLFEPNWKTHAAFGEALQDAHKAGVHILVYDSKVTADSIEVGDEVPVRLFGSKVGIDR